MKKTNNVAKWFTLLVLSVVGLGQVNAQQFASNTINKVVCEGTFRGEETVLFSMDLAQQSFTILPKKDPNTGRRFYNTKYKGSKGLIKESEYQFLIEGINPMQQDGSNLPEQAAIRIDTVRNIITVIETSSKKAPTSEIFVCTYFSAN